MKLRIYTTAKAIRLVLLSLIAGSALMMYGPTDAYAAGEVEGSATGLLFSPPIIELDLNPGESYVELIKIQNTGEVTQTYYPQVMDFLPRGEEGGQEFVAASDGETPYSLASWVSYPTVPITLEPSKRTAFTINISVPLDAEPGGKYAGFLLGTTPPKVDGTGVGVSTLSGPIILGNVGGEVTESLTVAEFSSDSGYYEYIPATFTVRLENRGSVHVKPVGHIRITNMFGKEVSVLPVNEALGNVLPDSVRKFGAVWQDSGIKIGKYQAALTVTYGSTQDTVQGLVSFWVLPWKIIVVGILATVIIVWLLLMGLKRYNAWIIRKARNDGEGVEEEGDGKDHDEAASADGGTDKSG